MGEAFFGKVPPKKEKDMKLVILAAGMGSRYGGLKQLDPISENGEFIIDFSVFDAKNAGFDEIVFIIKKENLELFRETVGERLSGKIKVSYAFQDIGMLPEGYTVPEGRVKPWGTGHALLCAENAVGEDKFAVINADDFYGRDTFNKIASYLEGVSVKESRYCMAGYVLKNTLTENGSVSRGICTVNEQNDLVHVVERTKIYTNKDGNTVYEEDGTTYPTDENGYVSMNCWGFTPSIFKYLKNDFKEFLDTLPPEKQEKGEFYLPFAVASAIERNDATVKLLPTNARWYGVTYADDKPFVKQSIKALIDKGEYSKNGIWKN